MTLEIGAAETRLSAPLTARTNIFLQKLKRFKNILITVTPHAYALNEMRIHQRLVYFNQFP